MFLRYYSETFEDEIKYHTLDHVEAWREPPDEVTLCFGLRDSDESVGVEVDLTKREAIEIIHVLEAAVYETQ